ncbi:hypothetical protein PVAG01_10054 [Phlyctema vagabunda]|uniref:Uncharacterized protein n=1 Tax=Phlyctema vagabunda TaxID=108571 RepID=A0ABR4P4U8_9HELO
MVVVLSRALRFAITYSTFTLCLNIMPSHTVNPNTMRTGVCGLDPSGIKLEDTELPVITAKRKRHDLDCSTRSRPAGSNAVTAENVVNVDLAESLAQLQDCHDELKAIVAAQGDQINYLMTALEANPRPNVVVRNAPELSLPTAEAESKQIPSVDDLYDA